MTGRALLVNELTFLQYLCALSVNYDELKSCLAILLSGVSNQWPTNTHHFVLECLILCDRTLLAYHQFQSFSKGKSRKGVSF